MHGTTTGLESPERPDGPLFENSSDTARCACGDPLEGYDAGRGEATCEECARLRADGGEADHDLEHDPREFYDNWSPAVVEERLGDGETAKVSFATVSLRDNGALFWRTWDGEKGLLPQWRWAEVSFIDTESFSPDAGTRSYRQKRVTNDDWDRLPDAVREQVEKPEGGFDDE